MRRLMVAAALCATLLPIAACSDTPAANNANPTVSGSGSAPGSTGPSGGPGSTPGPGGGTTGTTNDKAACEAITGKLSAWGAAFADAANGLAAAGNDVKKVEVVVNKVKAANSKLAAELRAEGDKSKDPQLKKVAGDMAAALEKVNSALSPQEVANNPDKLVGIFDTPEYAAAAEAFEKLCGGA